MTLHRGDRLGDWVIDRPLGAGGMGSVYRCHSVLANDVFAAVKVLTEGGSSDFQKRFVQEMRTLAALNHPAIVKVLGGGRDDERGLLYMAMELVDGEDLASRLERGLVGYDDAMAIFEPVADALAYAHERGVAHRDIKPANIMLRADGTPVIVDFGIAVASGHTRITQEGMLPGTMVYLPPEAFEGVLPDPKSTDAYALGIVMWEAITGEQPFATDPSSSQGAAMAQVMGQKIRSEALDPGEKVPAGLRQAVLLTTDPEPDTRLNDLGEVRSLLRSGTAHGPVRTPRRRKKKKRSGLRVFAGVAAVLVALGAVGLLAFAVVGVGVGLWVYGGSVGPIVPPDRGPPVDLAAALRDAAFALERGDVDQARHHAGRAIDDHPEDPNANLTYGQLLLVEDRVLLARPYLCGAVEGGLGDAVPGHANGDLECVRGPGASVPLSSPLLAARLDLGAQIASAKAQIEESSGDAVAMAPGGTAVREKAAAPSRPSRASRPRPTAAPAEDAMADAEMVAEASAPAPPPPPPMASASKPAPAPAPEPVAVAAADEAEELDDVGSLRGGSAAGAGAAKQSSASIEGQTALSGAIDVRGELAPSAVEAVIRRSLGQLDYCYELALKTNPSLAGTVTIDFHIATSGTVTGPKVTKSTVSDSALQTCVVRKVLRWRFPADYGGATGVTFTVAFSR